MSNIKEVKSFIVNLSCRLDNGVPVIYSNGDMIEPSAYKASGNIYYRDTDGPLKSIGFEVVSGKESSTDTSINFDFEIIMHCDIEKQVPKFVKQYIDAVVKPVLAQYWLDTINTAIQVNNYVDENWKEDLEESSIQTV